MQKMIESFVDSTRKANCQIICPRKINCDELSMDFDLEGLLSFRKRDKFIRNLNALVN